VEFGTYGRPRPIQGLPQELSLAGSSFAAAHVSGMAADILKQNPMAGIDGLKRCYKKRQRELLTDMAKN
jgi:hypothetical protein